MKQPNCCIFSQLLIIILVINFSPDYQKGKKKKTHRKPSSMCGIRAPRSPDVSARRPLTFAVSLVAAFPANAGCPDDWILTRASRSARRPFLNRPFAGAAVAKGYQRFHYRLPGIYFLSGFDCSEKFSLSEN